jgi:hypothetical protein
VSQEYFPVIRDMAFLPGKISFPRRLLKNYYYYADNLTAGVEIRLLAFNTFPLDLHIQIGSGVHSTFYQIRPVILMLCKWRRRPGAAAP